MVISQSSWKEITAETNIYASTYEENPIFTEINEFSPNLLVRCVSNAYIRVVYRMKGNCILFNCCLFLKYCLLFGRRVHYELLKAKENPIPNRVDAAAAAAVIN